MANPSFIDMIDIKRNSGQLFRSFCHVGIGEGDGNGNAFGVRVFEENGEPADLAGCSCVGFFIRPDEITLVINGNTANGIAYVELPAAAYAKEGTFSLAIKVAGTGFADTLRIIDGTVINTTTGSIYDPSSEVPSLADLMDVIERAEDAAETIEGISITSEQISGTRYKIKVITT